VLSLFLVNFGNVRDRIFLLDGFNRKDVFAEPARDVKGKGPMRTYLLRVKKSN